MKEMIKCSIQKNCLSESAFAALGMYKVRNEIVGHILKKERIPKEIIDMFRNRYKNFSKVFFKRDVVKCVKENCKKMVPKNSTEIEKIISKMVSLKEELKKVNTPLAKNHRKILRLLISCLRDFHKKFTQKFIL